MKVYVLFECHDYPSFLEVSGVTSNEAKATEWVKTKFQSAMRLDRQIDPEETIDFNLIPDNWKLDSKIGIGYCFKDFAYYYKEFDLR